MSNDRTVTSERAALAQQQADLVAALTRQGSAPDGFDRTHIDRSADALLGKRRRMVEKNWPILPEALGDSFRKTFCRFADAHPVATDDATDDGRRFAEFLLTEHVFPLKAAPVLLAARLRSGAPVQTLRIDAHRWLGFRLPLLGTRVFRI